MPWCGRCTPSREDLEYTDHTKAFLQEVVNKFEKKILEVGKAEISKAKTHIEAYEVWSKWTNRLGESLFDDLEFKGDKFVSDFDLSGTRYAPGSHRGYAVQRISKWNVEAVPRTVFVTGFTLVLTSRHKQMVKEYAKLQGWNYSYAVFMTGDEIDTPWAEPTQVVDFEDMKKALPKKAKTPSNSYHPNAGRVKGSWDYWTRKGLVTEQPLPTEADAEIYWVNLQTSKMYQVAAILDTCESEASVIRVPTNRQAKFVRENPSIKEFVPEFVSRVVIDSSTLLSDDAKAYLDIDWETRNWVDRLDISKIDDPDLQHVHKVIHNRDELFKAYEANQSLAKMMRKWYDVKEYVAKSFDKTIYDKYPLLNHLNYTGKGHEHVYVYMNAAHAAESESTND